MTTAETELLLENARVVCGHPMTRRPVTKQDPATKQDVPVMDLTTNQQVTECYFAVAVPKDQNPDWKQTPWGQQIYARGCQDWPNGEHAQPTFSWKIADGDSMIPNKAGKKPAEREGWPGHWIIHCTTRFAVRCYHVGKYDPTQQIQEVNAIKCGDYCRVQINVKGNAPSQSPGVYINPALFELSRAGTPIISDSGPAAADVFGGGVQNTATPQGQTPATQAVSPAPDLLNPAAPGQGPTEPAAPAAEVKYYDQNNNGPFTEAQLLAAKYTPELIATLRRA